MQIILHKNLSVAWSQCGAQVKQEVGVAQASHTPVNSPSSRGCLGGVSSRRLWSSHLPRPPLPPSPHSTMAQEDWSPPDDMAGGREEGSLGGRWRVEGSEGRKGGGREGGK